MTEFLRVKNWEDFQQYKDRSPKWIKLHRDILTDYEFDQLTEVHQCHLVKIWLLASSLDNKIPNDPAWIARQIGAKSKVQLNQLVRLGFLVPYKSVQKRTETYLEKRREEESREEERESTRKRGLQSELPDLLLPDNWREYCQNKRGDLDPDSVFENFCDFYLGHGRTMKDWTRTWQRWCRNEKPANRQRQQTPLERISEQVRRREIHGSVVAKND